MSAISPTFTISGPPYPPQMAQLGGQPSVKLDDPICAVLLFLFLVSVVSHARIQYICRTRDGRYAMAVMTLIFSVARMATLAMRLAWASHLTNVNLAIAANVFTMAGVLLLYIVNLVFARRFLRDNARFGRHPLVQALYLFLLFCVAAMLIMVVTVTVYSFFTLDANVHRICRDVQLFAITYLAVLAFVPIPAVALALLFRRRPDTNIDSRVFWARLRLLLFTATLLSLEAGFRCGVLYAAPPATKPAWFDSKACFYCFTFAIEIIVVYSFIFSRFDRFFRRHGGGEKEGERRRWLNTELEVFGGHDDWQKA